MTAQLGGTVATNASGSRSYHFGPTRSNVDALSLVFAGGDTITLKRGEHHAENGFFNITTDQGAARSFPVPAYQSPAIKNAAGYYSRKGMDLIDLIIGSEGTLAIFTEITVRLLHAPNIAAGLSFFPGLGEAFAFSRVSCGPTKTSRQSNISTKVRWLSCENIPTWARENSGLSAR